MWYYAVRACDTGGKWSAYSAPIPGVAAHSDSNNGPRIITRSICVVALQNDSAWIQVSGVSQTFVPHPGTLPAAFLNEYSGQSCIRVAATNAGEFAFRHFKIA